MPAIRAPFVQPRRVFNAPGHYGDPPQSLPMPQALTQLAQQENTYIPFMYGVSVALAASGTGVGTINFAQDTEFELHEILASVDIDPGNLFSPNFFSVQLTDQRTTRAFFNQQMPQRIACGTVYENTIELRPIILPRNSSIQVDLTNLGEDPIIVTLSLKGYKVYVNSAGPSGG